MKIAFYLSFLFLVISSCKIAKSPDLYSLKKPPIPPGTIQIAENLYFDETEIANIDYLEYLYWTKRVYGSNSMEFLNALPDTTVWSQLNINYKPLEDLYLRHPAYFNHPLVGITYKQACDYTNWRSDRVMEMILVKEGLRTIKAPVSPDSAFSTEKHFNKHPPADEKQIRYYPEYSLPDSMTYFKAMVYADSINPINKKTCRKRKCDKLRYAQRNCNEINLSKTDSLPYGPEPTMSVECPFCRKDLISHLRDNVREITNIEGQFYGNSFIDSCEIDFNSIRMDSSFSNSFTGFRNMCTYKKWGE